MSQLTRKLRRERTNARAIPSEMTFLEPGVYPLKYGKSHIVISGRGAPSNADSPGTAMYNPPTPGTVAGNNPTIPGNVSGYSPLVPGTVSGTNPATPGNVQYNPAIVGTATGNYNPGTQYGNAVTNSIDNRYSEQFTFNFTWSGPTKPASTNSSTPYAYYVTIYSPASGSNPGNANYNPTVPSTAYYNSAVPGNANYNPPTGGNAVYNPEVPGTAKYNPVVPGNVAYNPPTPGTVGSYNPTVPGNYVSTNPATPGNIAYYNPPTGGNASYNPTYMSGGSYTTFYDNSNLNNVVSYNDHPWGPSTTKPAGYSYFANPGTPGYSVVNYNTSSVTPGNVYYNSTGGGNAVRNATVPGNANYNLTVPGNAVYNPDVPGNVVYNPATPGFAGTPFTTAGVVFPGGAIGSPGTYVAATIVKVAESDTSITVNVGKDATVTISQQF